MGTPATKSMKLMNSDEFDYINSKYSTGKKSNKIVNLRGYYGDYSQPYGGSDGVFNTTKIMQANEFLAKRNLHSRNASVQAAIMDSNELERYRQ